MTLGSSMSFSTTKTRVSALEKLKQTNAAKLEMETKKMEERIRALKDKMLKEKEERERQGGTRWASGATGPLTNLNQKTNPSKKASPKAKAAKVPRKIKVLSDEPIDNYIRKPTTKKLDHSVTKKNPCGQCEVNSSVWICRECSENYCDACFDQFHQKGALKKHTKTSFQDDNVEQFQGEKNLQTSVGTKSPVRSYGETTNTSIDARNAQDGQSLFNGTYDEEESAASFARALQEWRDQRQASKSSPRNHVTCADTSCGTSNEAITNDKKNIQISFHNPMSYGERLYLRKGRKDPSMIAKEPVDIVGKKKLLEENNVITTEENESDIVFSPNYRDMIQGLTTNEKRNTDKGLNDNVSSNSVLAITEVSDSEGNADENEGTFIVVEDGEDNVELNPRPVSQHGRVSIQEMWSTGAFTDPTPLDNLKECRKELESPMYVSPSLCSKPFSLAPTRKVAKTCKQPKQPSSSGGKRRALNKDRHERPAVHHAWKPKPRYKEMSEFFLAGVENTNNDERALETSDNIEPVTLITEYSLSKGNLPTTWHPDLSYTDTSHEKQDNQHQALFESIQGGMTQLTFDERTIVATDTKPSESYSLCSKVGNEPRLNRGSDEDEDILGTVTMDFDDFGTGDQDEDDRETLDDLAWELASSTGRLTRCEEDILNLESDDEVSIEDRDGGSGLTTPETLLERSRSFHESIMDDFEEMERKFMEEEF